MTSLLWKFRCTILAAFSVVASQGSDVIPTLNLLEREDRKKGDGMNCDPKNAPHVVVNRSRMLGDDAPFQAWRATANSVDLRFYAFPSGYKEGDPWGKSCGWPVKFICSVRTVAIRPSRDEMQIEGVGPGFGKRNCTWEQASTGVDGKQHHCHVYLYNLQGASHLEHTHYHAWCMACIGYDCEKSDDSMVHPRPEYVKMSTKDDYQRLLAAMQDGGRPSLSHDLELSNGQVIKGYLDKLGYVPRTITGYRHSQKENKKVRSKKHLPSVWSSGLEIILDDGLPLKTVELDAEAAHTYLCIEAMVACVALILYISWSMFGLQRYVKLLHETGLATLLGYAIGFFKIFVAEDREYIEFSFELMSLVVLPVVIFAAGYNLNRKSFFRYSPYIVLYGFLGTIIFFFLCFNILMLAPKDGFATSRRGVPFEFDMKTCLVLAAVLSCCDTVAPLTLINPAALSVLYAVVFGEAVLNDVVGVLLSAGLHEWDEVPSAGQLITTVAFCSMSSLLIGLIVGAFISYLWARCPSLQTRVLQPVLLMMLMSYMSYLIAEALEQSAIFAIFICGGVCSHYAAKSMSHEAQHFAMEAVEMLAYLCEASMFVFFGFASATYLSDLDRFPISVEAIIFCALSVVGVRLFVLTLLFSLMKVLKGWRPLSVSLSTTTVVELCGCIRGTICYALIIRYVPSFEYRNTQEQLLVSTILGVVNGTTLTFGCILPLAINCLSKDDENGANLSALPVEGGAECEVNSPQRVNCADASPPVGPNTWTSGHHRQVQENQQRRFSSSSRLEISGVVENVKGIGRAISAPWQGGKVGSTFERTPMPFTSEKKRVMREARRYGATHRLLEFANWWKGFDKKHIMPLLCKQQNVHATRGHAQGDV